VITGIDGLMVIASVREPAPELLVAVIVAVLVPSDTGMPVISPCALMLSPEGSPTAVKLVGELVAVAW
jgi:hypothetical protein